MEIPKSKYNVGDKVIVRCDEYPAVPFPATVSAVWWCSKYGQHEYRVMEPDECESDGYTDEWISPLNVKEHAPLSAGANVDHGVDVEITGKHVNRAADRGCCVSSCSHFFIFGAAHNAISRLRNSTAPSKSTSVLGLVMRDSIVLPSNCETPREFRPLQCLSSIVDARRSV